MLDDMAGDTRAACVVVAAAIISGAEVLAAQRSSPPALAGLWEFPGGKVEPGETETAALVRECQEELGVSVSPQRLLGEVRNPYGRGGVRLWLTVLADAASLPMPLEHRELRWLSGEALDSVEWLSGNLAFLEVVRPLLS